MTRDVTERLVRTFVHEILQWNLSVARAETSTVRVGRSTIVPTLTAMELGIVGHGCDGTKPIGAAPHDPELTKQLYADPLGTRRYQALRDRDRQTADVILFDAHGDQVVAVMFNRRVIECSLAHRVGFQIAEERDPKTHARWLGKIAAKDSRPALDAAERLGNECLQSAAVAWFSVE